MMFLTSAPWDGEWWVWHLVRFATYAWVLAYVGRKYVRMVSDLQRSFFEADSRNGGWLPNML